jgi:hypothetical protein
MKSEFIPGLRISASEFFRGDWGIRLTGSLIIVGMIFLLPRTLLMADEDDVKQPFLPPPVQSVSTVPAINGDLNPYGVAFVPRQFPTSGVIKPGDIIVSNFNNSQNLQGTGTTIVKVSPTGQQSLFFHGTTPLGLTTALDVLRRGFVLVGNFPSANGACDNAQRGSIVVIDSKGNQAGNIVDPSIEGPWDAALFDQGSSAKFFIANGLSGTIVRLDLDIGPAGVSLDSATEIASGYLHHCDQVTFVDAPTGLVYDPEKDVLYVASTVDNAVFAISDAAATRHDRGRGQVIYEDTAHLHGALAMVKAPNGHLLVSNNDAINADPKQPSEIVEFTVDGKFVKQTPVDPNPGGSFGLGVMTSGDVARFGAVDDNANSILIWTLSLP